MSARLDNSASYQSGAFYQGSGTSTGGQFMGRYTSNEQLFDASRSSSTYQDNAPVQQKAVQMYLEFYLN